LLQVISRPFGNPARKRGMSLELLRLQSLAHASGFQMSWNKILKLLLAPFAGTRSYLLPGSCTNPLFCLLAPRLSNLDPTSDSPPREAGFAYT